MSSSHYTIATDDIEHLSPERYGGFPDLEGDSYGGRCRDLLPSAAAMASVSSYLTHHKNHHHEIDRSRRRKARSERKKKKKTAQN